MVKSPDYQPHIDGLRALAIVPVLLFHTRTPGFTGGYVGVDIFFVISGYLITGILVREIDRGDFSVVRFYERRARRILPALFVMLFSVVIIASILFLPGDFESLPASLLATALFLSNVFFFSEISYFDTGVDVKPLLHTWSLGIEEQFYIGFPLFLIVIARFAPRWRRHLVGVAAIASLALAILYQGDRSGFSFYLLPTRAWELLAGALLALGVVPPIRSGQAREIIALLGMATLGYATIAYSSVTSFPGITALPPVLAAVALIHCGAGTRVGGLLSSKLLIGIGLISFSLYLWHWPLIVFTEYAIDRRLDGIAIILVVLASLGMAIFSWRFVEAPFRKPSIIGQRAIFSGSVAAIATACALALILLPLGGWSARFAPEVGRMADAKFDVSPQRALCHDTASSKRSPCILGTQSAAPTALLWGDSHGVELSYALGRMAASKSHAIIERTQSSCPPVLDYMSAAAPACATINQEVLETIHSNPQIHTIYLVGFWASPAYRETAKGLNAVIADLLAHRRHVVLIGAIPPNKFDVPRRLARLARSNSFDRAPGPDLADIADSEARMNAVSKRWRGYDFLYLDPARVLCPRRLCALLAQGRPLYFDHHHLSVTGASMLLNGFSRTTSLPLD